MQMIHVLAALWSSSKNHLLHCISFYQALQFSEIIFPYSKITDDMKGNIFTINKKKTFPTLLALSGVLLSI